MIRACDRTHRCAVQHRRQTGRPFGTVRSSLLAVLGSALTLGGCGNAENVATSGPEKREAGHWKTETKLVKFELAGDDPGQIRRRTQEAPVPASVTGNCLTQEQAGQEDIVSALASSYGDACIWEKNRIGGGRIDALGTCSSNGRKVELTMTGTFATQRMEILVTSKGRAPGAGDMEMQVKVVSTHIGPCGG